MKIRDIIKEDVDMSWWRERDSLHNPEANAYAEKQERRTELLSKESGATPVFTKPVRSTQNKFSNKPPKDGMPSAGYLGLTDVRTRAKHISQEIAAELTGLDHPRSPQLPK